MLLHHLLPKAWNLHEARRTPKHAPELSGKQARDGPYSMSLSRCDDWMFHFQDCHTCSCSSSLASRCIFYPDQALTGLVWLRWIDKRNTRLGRSSMSVLVRCLEVPRDASRIDLSLAGWLCTSRPVLHRPCLSEVLSATSLSRVGPTGESVPRRSNGCRHNTPAQRNNIMETLLVGSWCQDCLCSYLYKTCYSIVITLQAFSNLWEPCVLRHLQRRPCFGSDRSGCLMSAAECSRASCPRRRSLGWRTCSGDLLQ